jgi:uncharacterized protein (TIGR02444 family)
MECNSVTDTPRADASDAWRFAVDIYGRPGVRAACLGLQDRRRADVVAMLALLHGVAGGHPAPSLEALRAALQAIAPWRLAAILPLRRIRRDLKGWAFPGDAALGPVGGGPVGEQARQAVAAAELAAERAELDYLARRLDQGGPGPAPGPASTANRAAAMAALDLYGRAAGLAFDAADLQDLAILAAAALPDSPPETAAPAGDRS